MGENRRDPEPEATAALHCLDCGAEIAAQYRDHGGGKQPKRCPEHTEIHETARVLRKETLRRYRRHGLTEDRYLAMLEAQGGVCAICKTDTPDSVGRSWNIDHDHSCCPGSFGCAKCVRALLCQSCNQGIGYFLDDPVLVQSAMDYLKRTSVGPKPGEV